MPTNWSNLSILLTGGTGSFGRAFTEYVLKYNPPKKLIIFSRDELKQHEMRQEFGEADPLRYFIGDVRDRDRLPRAMSGVDVVLHAAALKHVPACEYNPFEAVKTNIIGTQNVIETALRHDAEKVLAISTDKAADPASVLGASKLMMERLVTAANATIGKNRTR